MSIRDKRIAITEFHRPIELSINPLTLTCNLGDNPGAGKSSRVDTKQQIRQPVTVIVGFSAGTRRYEVEPCLPDCGQIKVVVCSLYD
jgi:hypothetical protein